MILKKLVFYFRPQRREFLFLSRLSINSTFLFFFFRARAYIRFGDVTEKSTVTVWNPSWKHRSLIIIKKSDKKLNNKKLLWKNSLKFLRKIN